MRGALRVALLLTVVVMLASAALPSAAKKAKGKSAKAHAASAAVKSGGSKVERELVGVRIWRSYLDVMKKLGQPTRIEATGTTSPAALGMGSINFGSSPLGGTTGNSGLPGLPGLGTARQSAFGGSAFGGNAFGGGLRFGGRSSVSMPGAGYGGAGQVMGAKSDTDESVAGGASAPAAPMGGGFGGGSQFSAPMGGGYGGAMGMGARAAGFRSRGSQRRRDEEEQKDSGPGVATNFTARPLSGLGATGLGGGYTSNVTLPANESGEPEVTWVYERTTKKVVEGVTKESVNTLLVLFNKDGRVIQVQTFGYTGVGITGRGIKLGDSLDKVYKRYGWTASISRSGDSMTLDYYRPANVAFQLIDLGAGKGYKVVGITVAATDRGG